MAFQVKEKLNDNSFESKAGFDTWGAKVSLSHLDIILLDQIMWNCPTMTCVSPGKQRPDSDQRKIIQVRSR